MCYFKPHATVARILCIPYRPRENSFRISSPSVYFELKLRNSDFYLENITYFGSEVYWVNRLISEVTYKHIITDHNNRVCYLQAKLTELSKVSDIEDHLLNKSFPFLRVWLSYFDNWKNEGYFFGVNPPEHHKHLGNIYLKNLEGHRFLRNLVPADWPWLNSQNF